MSEFFYGLHCDVSGLVTKYPYLRDDPHNNFNMGPKPVGIWLGHYMLWSALNLLPDSHFMICEIDAKFPNDWHTRIFEALRDVPQDYDLLYVGSCACKNMPKRQVKGEVFEVMWPVCLHCYIVAKKALPVLIATQRKVYAPIDISLAIHSFNREPWPSYAKAKDSTETDPPPQTELRAIKVFTVLPRIVEQFDTDIPP